MQDKPAINLLFRRKNLLPSVLLRLEKAFQIQKLLGNNFIFQLGQPALMQGLNLQTQQLLLFRSKLGYPFLLVEFGRGGCHRSGSVEWRCLGFWYRRRRRHRFLTFGKGNQRIGLWEVFFGCGGWGGEERCDASFWFWFLGGWGQFGRLAFQRGGRHGFCFRANNNTGNQRSGIGGKGGERGFLG